MLVPSHSETYGLIALEAAASGVPVVAAASGGLRESVVDGVTGIVLTSREPQAWARAMTQVLADAVRRTIARIKTLQSQRARANASAQG